MCDEYSSHILLAFYSSIDEFNHHHHHQWHLAHVCSSLTFIFMSPSLPMEPVCTGADYILSSDTPFLDSPPLVCDFAVFLVMRGIYFMFQE
jgi:hypothetical protein